MRFNNKTSKRTKKENQNWIRQAYIVSFFASDTAALANWNKMIFIGNKHCLSSLCKEVLVKTSLWRNVSKIKNKSRLLSNGQCYLQKRCLLFEGPMGRGLLFVMDFWRVALWALFSNTCNGRHHLVSAFFEWKKINKADFLQVQFAFKNFVFKTWD